MSRPNKEHGIIQFSKNDPEITRGLFFVSHLTMNIPNQQLQLKCLSDRQSRDHSSPAKSPCMVAYPHNIFYLQCDEDKYGLELLEIQTDELANIHELMHRVVIGISASYANLREVPNVPG
jgi:hypothetical protein